MKTILIILFASTSSYSQTFKILEHGTMLEADTLTVKQAFDVLDSVIPRGHRSCPRYVTKDGRTYVKYCGILIGKKKTFLVENGKETRIEI